MASSGKTEQLQLSLWEAGDRPERLDFRQDNEKLEELLGGHLSDPALHLTATQKEYMKRPWGVHTYRGTGYSAQYVSTITPRPGAILVFCMEAPPTLPMEDGKTEVFTDFWAPVNRLFLSQEYIGGGAVDVAANGMIGFLNLTKDNVVYSLNKKGYHYAAFYFGAY